MNLGVLWKNKTRDGKEFLAGNIEVFPHGTISIAVFKNEYKTKDNQPDYKIVYTPLSEEQGKQSGSTGSDEPAF